MDNIINKEWLEGLQEIREINAAHQDEETADGARTPSRAGDFDEMEPPSSGKIEKQKQKQIVDLPPIKRPNSVKRRPRKAPVVVQQLRLAEEELLMQYKKQEEEKMQQEKAEMEKRHQERRQREQVAEVGKTPKKSTSKRKISR